MSNVFSGGVAFSYFPAASVQGQFGMVNISSDQTTVQVSDDFTQLKAQLTAISPPNSPAQSSAGASTYGACPSTNSTWVASTTLPPTPNLAACGCLENALSCQFTPQTTNYTAIVGELLDFGCSQLGQDGGSCNDLSSNGQTGVYGVVSGCDPSESFRFSSMHPPYLIGFIPAVQLSYVMSEFYELNSRAAQACSFAGNGTVNASAPSESASAAASSCISNPSATFTPTAPAGASGGGSNGGSGSGGGGSNSHDGATGAKPFIGIAAMALVSLAGGLWTLL
jgi:hypothetical protein